MCMYMYIRMHVWELNGYTENHDSYKGDWTLVNRNHYWSWESCNQIVHHFWEDWDERAHGLLQTLKNLIDHHTSEIRIISNNILSKHGSYSWYWHCNGIIFWVAVCFQGSFLLTLDFFLFLFWLGCYHII